MALEPVNTALRVVHDNDPCDLIWRDMGVLPGEQFERYGNLLEKFRVGGEDVLVVRYERREDDADIVTPGGIIVPQTVADNDKWMGNTGLVVKMGPLAYQTEKTLRWFVEDDEAMPPEIGDWVFFDPTLSKGFMFGKRYCFLVPAQYIFGVLAEPDIVQ